MSCYDRGSRQMGVGRPGRSESHEYESEPTRAGAAPSDGSQGPSEGPRHLYRYRIP